MREFMFPIITIQINTGQYKSCFVWIDIKVEVEMAVGLQKERKQQIKCKFETLKMEGQQLPKATMNAFLKQKTNLAFTPDYLNRVLTVSKQFVVRLSDKANVMCESYSKKTISAEHLEAAMKQFGITEHLEDLHFLQGTIKETNQLKREASQRMEEMLAKDLEEERERRKLEEQQKKEVTVREKFDEFQKVEGKGKGQEDDYENIIDLDASQSHPQSPGAPSSTKKP